MQFQQYNSPWFDMVDRGRYEAEVAKLEAFDTRIIASTHGPAFVGPADVAHAFELLRRVPDEVVPPQPGQAVLDEIVAAMLAGAPA